MNALLNKLERYFKTDIRYIVNGGFWLTGAKGLAMLVTLISSVAFANLLPEETYGTYRYIISLLALLALPTLPGINTAVTTAIARGNDGTYKTGMLAKLKWGVLAGILTTIVSAYYYYKGNYSFGHIFALSAILMPLAQASYLYVSILNGKKAFRSMSLHLSASRIFVVVVLVTTIFYTSNLLYIFIAYFFSYITSQLISSHLTKRHYIQNEATETGAVSYGKHLSIMQAVTVTANNLDKILLFQFTGPVTLAGYYLALMPFKQIKNILSTINVLALPKLSSVNMQDIRQTLPSKLLKFYIVVIPIVISYIVLAPFLFSILFPNFVEFVFISQIFALILLLSPFTLINTALTALKQKKQLYFISTSTAFIRCVLLLVAVPLWGLAGAVGVVVASQVYTSVCLVTAFYMTYITHNND